MQFDTKVALVIRTDLEAWQKLNVAAFLASGIAAAFPDLSAILMKTAPARTITR
jgi:hypothetical protein